jgi:hypothetical protein
MDIRVKRRATRLGLTAVLALAGCTTVRSTEPNQTATEQLLITTAIDHAAAELKPAIPTGSKVFVDPQYFDAAGDSAPYPKYAMGAVRDELLQEGAHLVADRKSADIVVEPRSGAQSITTPSSSASRNSAYRSRSPAASTSPRSPSSSATGRLESPSWRSPPTTRRTGRSRRRPDRITAIPSARTASSCCSSRGRRPMPHRRARTSSGSAARPAPWRHAASGNPHRTVEFPATSFATSPYDAGALFPVASTCKPPSSFSSSS